MYIRFFIIILIVLFSSCGETEFNAGLENRITAIIDMAPEPDSYGSKVDFTSDDEVGGCPDSEMVTLDRWSDGSDDNQYFTITIEAKDYFKSANNCYDWGLSVTAQELIRHQLRVVIYANEINEQMYVAGSRYIQHPNYPSNNIIAYYLLESDQDGETNGGVGIEYYGYDAELDIAELDLVNGVISGSFNATLFRGTEAPNSFMGVDNPPNVDLFNPPLNDFIQDIDGDGYPDYHLTDSIRIEDLIFQRVNIINNI
ncbi:MAG: hypothetical protein CMP54_01245 [Flavobacteriales bacterium]|nr:hypothetical protein [Flavobacteriales bacterium]